MFVTPNLKMDGWCFKNITLTYNHFLELINASDWYERDDCLSVLYVNVNTYLQTNRQTAIVGWLIDFSKCVITIRFWPRFIRAELKSASFTVLHLFQIFISISATQWFIKKWMFYYRRKRKHLKSSLQPNVKGMIMIAKMWRLYLLLFLYFQL